MKSIRVVSIIFGLLTLPCTLASAHPLHMPAGQGFTAGFMHPLLGLDHLLTMVAVGLLSAQLAGRALWAIPATFAISMVAGGIVGMGSGNVALVEYAIAASVIALGTAVAWNRRLPWTLAILSILAFGYFHGHAHGTELPLSMSPLVYIAGFFASTLTLHAAGVIAGIYMLRSVKGAVSLRFSGGAIAIAGLCFALLAW